MRSTTTGFDEVAAELREDDAAADSAHLVARPADALETLRHRAGRLDLDHQFDGAHVDAQLQRAGGHHGPQPARLEVLLDLDALLTADGPMVRAGDVLASQLVQPGAEPLREASRVGEHDRR